MICSASAVSDRALSELVSPPRVLEEPDDELVARAGGYLERHGWLRRVAGDEDFALGARAFAKALKNKMGIIASGASGVGKTAFLMAAFGTSTLGTAFVDLADPLEAEKLDATIWPIRRATLLRMHVILDDMGAEARTSNFGQPRELAAEFVHAYHAHGKGLLAVSTNLDGRQFLERYEQRVFTRLLEIAVPVKFTGASKRSRQS